MKKNLWRILSFLLCAALLGSFALTAPPANAASYQTGDIIEFGSYPQTDVTEELGDELNAQDGTWQSYNYYSGTGLANGEMVASDYMRYKDVNYSGSKYRGVTFSQYRPVYTGGTLSSKQDSSYQFENGYHTEAVYWFKYEPLKLRILDASAGLVLCETIIDSQAYTNYLIYDNDDEEYYNDKGAYSPDWETSSLNTWLNNDFYSTAFDANQQNAIIPTSHSTKGYKTLNGITGYEKYDTEESTEKIFLLSYDEVINSNYGFNEEPDRVDPSRQAKGSDYAKCQGLSVYHSSGSKFDGYSHWLLRSCGYGWYTTCLVGFDGDVNYSAEASITYFGVRPAFRLNLSLIGSQASFVEQPTAKPSSTDSNDTMEDDSGHPSEPSGESAQRLSDSSTILPIAVAIAVLLLAGLLVFLLRSRKKKAVGAKPEPAAQIAAAAQAPLPQPPARQTAEPAANRIQFNCVDAGRGGACAMCSTETDKLYYLTASKGGKTQSRYLCKACAIKTLHKFKAINDAIK